MKPRSPSMRVFSLALVCLFVSGNIPAPDDNGRAAALFRESENSQIVSNLAPSASVDQPDFKEKFRARQVALSHRAVNHYIKETLEKEICFGRNPAQKMISANGVDILAISVHGLLRKTGLLAHVGLGRARHMPVMYIDKEFFDSEEIIAHEADEIAQWEAFRREELQLERHRMRDWIMKNPERARQKAREFHGKSRPVKGFYAFSGGKADLDYGYIATLVDIYGAADGENDVVIAALPEKPGTPSAGKDGSRGTTRDAVFLALFQIFKDGSGPAKYEGVKNYLSKQDPFLVARSIIECMMFLEHTYCVEAQRLKTFGADTEERESRHPSVFVPRFPKKYESDLSGLFSDWTPIADGESLRQFGEHIAGRQNAFLKLALALGPDVTGEFIKAFEKEYYRRNISLYSLKKRKMLFSKEAFQLPSDGRAALLKSIEGLKAMPAVGYGVFSFAYTDMEIRRSPEYAFVRDMPFPKMIDELESAAGENERAVALTAIYDFLLSRGTVKKEADGEIEVKLERVNLKKAGIDEAYGKKLFSVLTAIMDTPEHPFTARRAFRVCALINDIPPSIRQLLFLTMVRHVIKDTDDMRFRCWLARNTAPHSFSSALIDRESLFLTELLEVLEEETDVDKVLRIMIKQTPLSNYEVNIIQLLLADPSRTKGSPARFLGSVRADKDLLEGMISPAGVSFKEILRNRRPYSPRTVRKEISILRRLGILANAPKRGDVRFSDLITGEDINRVPRIIDALKNIRKDIGRTAKPLDRNEIPKSEMPAVRRLVDNAYDAENARYLIGDIFSAPFDGRIYEVRYDVSRLSVSQADVVEEYIRTLQLRAVRPDRIRARPFSSGRGKREPLITVRCVGTNFRGEGSVDVVLASGDIGDYRLRITGMMNIALAASNIPENIAKDQIRAYNDVVRLIRNQYRAISGEDLIISDASPSEFLEAIQKIVLELPASERMPLKKIEEYNMAMREAMLAA
ncbi:MAG: hypothetical protein JW919_05920 [Candidatus Omnitrophica bacterium]|nr:hypothetical protein [Candidatus Omnitrophota bacterium]